MRILFLLSLFGLTLAQAQQTKQRIVTIEPNMSAQNYEHFRRMVYNSPDSEIEGGLEGFDFEWGYRYQIKVKETELDGYLSDGTRFEYEFVEVVSKEKAKDTVFKMFVDPKRYYYNLPPEEEHLNVTLIEVNDSIYEYLEDVEIIIPEDLRPAIRTIIESGKGRLGYFRFAPEGRIRLVKF